MLLIMNESKAGRGWMIKNIMMNERDDDQKLVEDEFHEFRGKNQKNPTFLASTSANF